jgi:hypothetical protein
LTNLSGTSVFTNFNKHSITYAFITDILCSVNPLITDEKSLPEYLVSTVVSAFSFLAFLGCQIEKLKIH